jgi:hypothetical protein
MKKLFLSLAILSALAFSGSSLSANKPSETSKRKSAVARFEEPVTMNGVVLKGEYLFVHDDAAMLRGEACTTVYKGTAPVANRLVASFHCTPLQRVKVRQFSVRTEELAPGIIELREIQFAGETESHLVPGGK